jgi:hypothetical protein
MLSIKFDLEELSELEGYYTDLQQRAQDLRPIQRELDDIQREELKLRFLSSPATLTGGVVHGDVYWNRLSDWYLNQVPRRRKGQIMIDSGRLKNEATNEGSGNSSSLNQNSYEFKLNTPYAGKQDTMRQLLFWNEGLLQKTEAAILNYINTGETP